MAQGESSDCLPQRQWMSTDPETVGFDLSSGYKWIFPENYPKRDYQFSIIQTALFNNTLICLPTGLGKTFIAAVVMYNFWRWYPKGRIVFLAPTKPLVAQQIHACHDIMGIPSDETIELTGTVHQNKRAVAWTQKRIIFATPQTFQKDLQNEIVPCDLIKCLIFDEAHKALGKHSYSEIIRLLSKKSKYFRVLGLSATPGSKIDQVCEVLKNLLISKLELRDDTSPDIVPYINSRSMSKIIIKLNPELATYKNRYLNVISPHFNVLVQANILRCDIANVSKARIFALMNSYKSKQNKDKNHGSVMKAFTVLLTMFHAYELLTNYGLRAFYNFYQNHTDKFWYESENNLKQLLIDIKEYIGDFPVINTTDEMPEIPNNLIFGHDKFFKLKEVLEEHFRSCEQQSKNTRAIIFIEYRDIVNEVFVLLLQSRPLIRPQMFVGRAGLKQKQQIQALEDFRNNKVNVLISTSVGEEGLDVGEVDLIICFDIISSTPIRLVQRIGRTGRKRSGNVIMLVTDSHELKTLNQAMAKKDSMNSKVLKSLTVIASLYKESPRMVPVNCKPECFSIFIKVQPKISPVKTKKKLTIEKKKKKNTNNTEVIEEVLSEPANIQVPTNVVCSKKDPTVIFNNQPSLLKFFSGKKSENDSSSNSLNEFFVGKKRKMLNDIKFNNIKLLSDDNKANEFLILCAIKQSKLETVKKFINIDPKYILNDHVEKDLFSSLIIPTIDTLSCISTLNECILPADTKYINENSFNFISSQDNNLWDCMLYQEFGKPVCTDYSSPDSKYSWNIKEPAFIEKDFEDLLDENTESESVDGNSQKIPSNEFSEKNIFDDLLDASTDEENNTILEKTIFNKNEISNNVTLTPKNNVDGLGLKRGATSPNESVAAEKNIYDDLLDASTDEENNTILEKNILDENESLNNVTLTPKSNVNILSLKRGATSPNESMPTKKVKVANEIDNFDEDTYFDGITFTEIDSNIDKEAKYDAIESIKNESQNFENKITRNDNENIVQLTNEKMKDENISLINISNDNIETQNCLDSDEDLFDGIDSDMPPKYPNIELTNKYENKEFPDFKSNEVNSKTNLIDRNEESPNMFEKEDFFDNESIESSSKNIVEQPVVESPNMFEKTDFFNRSSNSNSKSSEIISRNNVLLVDKESPNMFDATDFFECSQKLKSVENFSKSSLTTTNKHQIKDLNNSFDIPSDISELFVDDFVWNDNLHNNKQGNLAEKNCNIEKNYCEKTKGLQSGINFKANENSSNISKNKTTNTLVNNLAQAKTNFQNVLSDKNSKKISNKEIEVGDTVKRKNNKDDFQCLMVNKMVNDIENIQPDIVSNKKKHPGLNLSRLKKDKTTPICDNDGFRIPNLFINPNKKEDNKIKENKETVPGFSGRQTDKYFKNKSSDLKQKNLNKKKGNKKKKNDFIFNEAEVSDDELTTDGSSEEDEENDLDGFVSYTQDIPEDVDMRGLYLKTTKSPVRNGAFLFKKLKNVEPDYDIYSQPATQDNTYLHDTFCVKDDECELIELSGSSSDESFTENIDARKRKSSMQKEGNSLKKAKTKRIIVLDGSSSEDEIEILRKQVMENSTQQQ